MRLRTMARPLQRDVATGKLQRDVATGKLMRNSAIEYGVDCGFCVAGQTPKYLTMSISGLVDCVDCNIYWNAGPLARFESVGVAAVLNNAVVILEQEAASPCTWSKEYLNGDFGTLISYPNAGCAGIPTNYALDRLKLGVSKSGALTCIVDVIVEPTITAVEAMHAFFFSGNPGAFTGCIGRANIASQSDCTWVPPWNPPTSSGLITVVEGEGIHYAPASSQYQSRYPTGDHSVQWSRSAGANNWDLVNDHVDFPDDDATYTHTNVGWDRDYFSFIPFTIPTNSRCEPDLTIHARYKRMEAGGAPIIRQFIIVRGILYYGASQDVLIGMPNVYVDKSHTWTNNPATNLPWTSEDLNGTGPFPLEYFGHEYMGFDKILRCTQLYAKSNYDYYW